MASVLLSASLLVPLANSCSEEKVGNLVGDQLTVQQRGIWTAPGGPKCKWKKTHKNKHGQRFVVASGRGDKKQLLIISTSDIAADARVSSSGCGVWK